MSTYLDFAKQLALEAGEIMLDHFMIGVEHETKPDKSPVTLADKEVNSHVINAVAEAYPDHSVRGEEESNHSEGDKHVWVCDPIDGTLPYSLGIPTNVFSLALVEDGVPIASVVYDPYMKRLYYAEKGKGAFMNDRHIHVSDRKFDHNAPIALANYHGVVDTNKLHTIAREKRLKIFLHHSDVYAAMLVASGQFTAKVSVSEHPHDSAASKLIVEEAGGKVTDLNGDEQRYDGPINGAVITNGVVHSELLEMIRQST